MTTGNFNYLNALLRLDVIVGRNKHSQLQCHGFTVSARQKGFPFGVSF